MALAGSYLQGKGSAFISEGRFVDPRDLNDLFVLTINLQPISGNITRIKECILPLLTYRPQESNDNIIVELNTNTQTHTWFIQVMYKINSWRVQLRYIRFLALVHQ